MVLRLALAFAAAMSVFPLDVAAQRQGRGYGYSGITVYEHPEFRGDSVTFRSEVADLRQHGLNDRISSLDVDGNQAWEVCRDINFGGGCRVFTGSIEDLRSEGWNDRISSIRAVGSARGNGNSGGWWGNQRRGRSSQLVIYDRPNFRGDARNILTGSSNLGSLGDRARSVEVYGGGSWELCDGAFRNARCVTIDQSVSDLRTLGLRNGVTSAREVGGQSRRWW